MEAIAIVTALTGLQLFWFSYLVGEQRQKHGVKAPAMSGHPDFERAFRVHQNTVEQLVIFLPGLWMFGYFVSPLIGAGLGLLFIVGRFVYRSSYMNDPQTRLTGFGLTAMATLALLIGSIVGAVISWLG